MDAVTLALAKAYCDKNRLAYSETGKAVVFQQTEFNIPYDEAEAACFIEMEAPFEIVIGKEYEVVWNGDTYKVVGKADEGTGSPCLGNNSLYGGENTGEPFCLFYMLYEGMEIFGAYALDKTEDVTVSVSVSTEIETIHPIDPKYIPALDALYLNGTDGKQYKVTVTDDGALTATEV